jgi:broad specificity phosphatase PhoE
MPCLYLVRHGQPDFAGDYDSVTALGLQQSAWLGEHFAARGLRFARAISGDLRRQVRTLETIAGRLAVPPPLHVDPRLNEYDPASVLAAFGAGDEQELRASGDRRAYFSALRDALRAWARCAQVAGGGESWHAFGERVRAAARGAGEGLGRSDAVLVVTSGGVIGRLVAEALGAGTDAAIELNLQTRNTGITELAIGSSASRLLSFNAVPHLERPERAHAVTHS